MALLTRSVQLSLGMLCRRPGPAPWLPLCIRHSATGDNNWGEPLRVRFVASAAKSASAAAVAERAGCRRQQDPLPSNSTAKKNLLPLLHYPTACAQQGRLFCTLINYLTKQGEKDQPEHDSSTTKPSFGETRNKLQVAVDEKKPQEMLESLRVLKIFVGSEDCYDDYNHTEDLLLMAVSPLPLVDIDKPDGLDLDSDVVKESLAVACLLLQNAPDDKVRTKLWRVISKNRKLKTSLKRIRDYHGSGTGCDEVSELAKEILRQTPQASTAK